MESKEVISIVFVIVLLSLILTLHYPFKFDALSLPKYVIFAAIIVLVSVFSKKAMAYSLDADVKHEIWKWSRYGFKPHQHTEKEIPMGAIIPLALSVLSLGFLKFMSFLTYETSALKTRAAKRFGFYSYTEMTDWHNGLIGAAGIVAILLLSLVSYFALGSNEMLWRFSAYYAFANLIPVSKLDGTQIFFGSKIIWAALAIITLVFFFYAVLLV